MRGAVATRCQVVLIHVQQAFKACVCAPPVLMSDSAIESSSRYFLIAFGVIIRHRLPQASGLTVLTGVTVLAGETVALRMLG